MTAGTANLYAADGTIEDPVGSPPVQGTQAIIAYLETFPTILNEIRVHSFDVNGMRSGGGHQMEVTF